MIKNVRLAILPILALVAAGPRAAPAQAESDEQATTVADHMHAQLTVLTTIKSAIIAGRLEDAREHATWLADHETVAGLPENFEPFLAKMRTYARHVIEAKELLSAAESVSKMAQTCGACHLANGVHLEFGYDQLPRQDIEDVVTHMQRHQWATDRLWEGLIGPSDRAWNRGVDMLIDVPLVADDVTTTSAHFHEIGEIASRIHALGGMGSETVTADARTELYGEVLGLCASCHILLNRGPAN